MGEDLKTDEAPTAGLTEPQQKLLFEHLAIVETNLYLNVLRKLKLHLTAAIGLFSLVGFIGLGTLRSGVVESAGKRLAEDASARQRVVQTAQQHIEDATNL